MSSDGRHVDTEDGNESIVATSSHTARPARVTTHILPMEPYNLTSASLLPSALGSPCESVLLEPGTAVFSKNNSFTTATAAEPPRDTGDVQQPGQSTEEPPIVINTLPAVIGYFGYTFGNGINAFYSVIFSEKMFTKKTIALLISVIPLFSVTLLPVLSYLADKYHCATKMLMCSAIISTSMMLAYTRAEQVTVIVMAFILMQACMTVMNPLLDQHTLSMFPRNGRSTAWSYVRSYGAYGWGIGCLVSALVVQHFKIWSLLVIQFAMGQLALLYCITVTKPYENVSREPVRVLDVIKLLRTNMRVVNFLCAACMMGMGYSFINGFLFLFLEELGGSKLLMGITVFLTVCTEIPMFQMAERLHATFTERQMMSMAMSLWVLRVIGYSLLPNAWCVLPLEPLHGITFAFSWLPSVHLISRAFPQRLASSATGVLFMFNSGIGPILGNVIGGKLYDTIGPRWMFRVAAIMMLTSVVMFELVDRLLERWGVSLVIDAPEEKQAMAVDVVIVSSDSKTSVEKDSLPARTADAADEVSCKPTAAVDPSALSMAREANRRGCLHHDSSEDELPEHHADTPLNRSAQPHFDNRK